MRNHIVISFTLGMLLAIVTPLRCQGEWYGLGGLRQEEPAFSGKHQSRDNFGKVFDGGDG